MTGIYSPPPGVTEGVPGPFRPERGHLLGSLWAAPEAVAKLAAETESTAHILNCLVEGTSPAVLNPPLPGPLTPAQVGQRAGGSEGLGQMDRTSVGSPSPGSDSSR